LKDENECYQNLLQKEWNTKIILYLIKKSNCKKIPKLSVNSIKHEKSQYCKILSENRGKINTKGFLRGHTHQTKMFEKKHHV
jgi:hypothetical protein